MEPGYQEEIAFYDALAENESAVEVMGNDYLRVIANELLNNLKGDASLDGQQHASARAPNLQDAAVQTVLQRAEVRSVWWVPHDSHDTPLRDSFLYLELIVQRLPSKVARILP